MKRQALPDLDTVLRDGFRPGGAWTSRGDPALLSLKISLRAFFDSYRGTLIEHYGQAGEPPPDDRNDPAHWHGSDFVESYMEAVIHLQHFLELLAKEVLIEESPLLGLDLEAKPVLLHQVIAGESIDEVELEGLRAIELSEALSRIRMLVAAGRISSPEAEVLARFHKEIAALNRLRNRALHRGQYVLHLSALDKFYAGHLFPLLKQVTAVKNFSLGSHVRWKHQDLACGLDPLHEINVHLHNDAYDESYVGALKELGRAAYTMPQPWIFGDDDNPHVARAMHRSQEIARECAVRGQERCLVCGRECMFICQDRHTDYEEVRTPLLVECAYCGFELFGGLCKKEIYPRRMLKGPFSFLDA